MAPNNQESTGDQAAGIANSADPNKVGSIIIPCPIARNQETLLPVGWCSGGSSSLDAGGILGPQARLWIEHDGFGKRLVDRSRVRNFNLIIVGCRAFLERLPDARKR